MFQIEIIEFFQSFDSAALKAFMSFISVLGTIPVILLIILGITFAIDFKRGLVLVNIISWTTIFTFFIKEQVNYPRPIEVDPSIETVYFETGNENLSDLLPKEFFDIFSEELLNETNITDFERLGFPSGHVSIQMALWIALSFLFKRKWIRNTGIVMVLLTALSRIYLGHHFLADVIGGAILGAVVSSLLLYLIKKSGYLTELSHQAFSLSFLWLPLILVPFAFHLPLWILGSQIGLNLAATMIILKKNFPVFHILTWKRMLAALISIVLISFVVLMSKQIENIQNDFLTLFIIILVNFGIILGSILLNNKLHLIRFRF